MVVDVVVGVATVAADVVPGTEGPDAVTVATDVVTAVVLGTVAGTVAVGDVTVAVGDVTVAVGNVTVVLVGTVTVVIGVDSVTVGSPIAPGWLPASTLAPKKPATATQTSAMTARRVTKRSAPRPPLVVPPQWARFLSPSTYILARSGYCRNPLTPVMCREKASATPSEGRAEGPRDCPRRARRDASLGIQTRSRGPFPTTW